MSGNMEDKKEILLTAYEYLEKLKSGCNVIVERFREGEEDEALKILANALEGISWLLDTFELTKDVQIESIEDYSIKDHLSEMEEALENLDYIMLADLIEYEVVPIIQKWNTHLKII